MICHFLYRCKKFKAQMAIVFEAHISYSCKSQKAHIFYVRLVTPCLSRSGYCVARYVTINVDDKSTKCIVFKNEMNDLEKDFFLLFYLTHKRLSFKHVRYNTCFFL